MTITRGIGRPSSRRSLVVWMNGIKVGIWTCSGSTGHSFTYDENWLDDERCRPISLSMPLSQGLEPYTGDVVESYFDNLLPDSREIRYRLAEHYGVRAGHAFEMLEQIGRDCVGAIQLTALDAEPPRVNEIRSKPLSNDEIEKLIKAQLAGRGITDIDPEDELRISIAGVQEKTALLYHDECWQLPHGATPTTHIIKLPIGLVGAMQADFSTSVENEWLCGKILEAFGLPVALSQIGQFGEYKVLIVERFDRRFISSGWLARIPQEDFCQVYGLPSEKKYQEKGGPGIDMILDTLRGSENAIQDRENFMRAQFIFWLLAAPDGHAKNFSVFIEQAGRYKLTPLYDVMSAWPAIGDRSNHFDRRRLKLAMGLKSKNMHYRIDEIRRSHWNATAKRNQLGKDFETTIQEILGGVDQVINHVSNQLPQGFPDIVSDTIFSGIRSQVGRVESMKERKP